MQHAAQHPQFNQGRGSGGRGGWNVACFGGGGAVLNSPFHSEHLEYAQVRGLPSPFTVHPKWGGLGGRERLCPGLQRPKNISWAPLGPKSVVPPCAPVCVWGGGTTTLKREARMGAGPPWLHEALS